MLHVIVLYQIPDFGKQIGVKIFKAKCRINDSFSIMVSFTIGYFRNPMWLNYLKIAILATIKYYLRRFVYLGTGRYLDMNEPTAIYVISLWEKNKRRVQLLRIVRKVDQVSNYSRHSPFFYSRDSSRFVLSSRKN